MTKKLKPIDFRILIELTKNSKVSDRKLAQIMGFSQPTITRRRASLEERELLDYTSIPNFAKLGFEIMAFSFVHYDQSVAGRLAKKIGETLSENPSIVFASSGRGLGYEGVAISIHRSFGDYADFLRRLRMEWGKHAAKIDSFTVSLGSDNITRQLTFKYLMEALEQS